jgi:hypothetical protein
MPLLETKGAASAQGFGEFAKVGAANYIEDVFSTWLYTGNGSTQTITNGIDLSTKGGLVWTKLRSALTGHALADTAQGVQKVLQSNNTNAQATYSGYITSFNSNGYAFGDASFYNDNLSTFVSWTFREQPKFFDVVTYTGDGTNNRQISHSLGSAPGFIIVKNYSGTQSWLCYHRSLGTGNYLFLNGTDTNTVDANAFPSVTSTTFTPTANQSAFSLNANGATYVAYLFAHNAGGFGLTGTDNVISCGSFTVDGSGNSSINLGYEPQWLLMKQTNTTGSWLMQDTMRGQTADNGYARLLANTSGAETSTTTGFIRINATGFSTNGATGLVGDHIYIAIRRGPMKTPTTGTSVFNSLLRTGTGATANVTGVGFPPDILLDTMRSPNWTRSMWDRLRGPNVRVATNQTAAENTYTDAVMSFGQDGVTLGADGNFDVNGSGYPYINWFFRRAPGFFDVVCYTGNGSTQTLAHNLGVAPELMFIKRRSLSADGVVYSVTLGATQHLRLFSTTLGDSGALATSGQFNNTSPTASVFSVGNNVTTNTAAETYVAYLFASCPGVSKVTNFTGTGSLQTINCGFTGGARWVLIKRTDAAGDWYVWDSARGISSSTDPYLLLNSTAAEVTSTNWVDTTSTGFQVTAASGNNVNINGASYIALAIS